MKEGKEGRWAGGGKGGREEGIERKGKGKKVIHWESHSYSTGACFDLNVLIEPSQSVFSLNALTIL